MSNEQKMYIFDFFILNNKFFTYFSIKYRKCLKSFSFFADENCYFSESLLLCDFYLLLCDFQVSHKTITLSKEINVLCRPSLLVLRLEFIMPLVKKKSCRLTMRYSFAVSIYCDKHCLQPFSAGRTEMMHNITKLNRYARIIGISTRGLQQLTSVRPII